MDDDESIVSLYMIVIEISICLKSQTVSAVITLKTLNYRIIARICAVVVGNRKHQEKKGVIDSHGGFNVVSKY